MAKARIEIYDNGSFKWWKLIDEKNFILAEGWPRKYRNRVIRDLEKVKRLMASAEVQSEK